MKPKLTSAASASFQPGGASAGSVRPASTPAPRVVIVTLDNHLASTVDRVRHRLQREIPGLGLSLHAASDWALDPASLERCKRDIAEGDIVVITMMFMEEHLQAVLPELRQRRASCDAMVCCLSSTEAVHLTRLGRFEPGSQSGGLMSLLRKLRGKAASGQGAPRDAGARQMAMLRRLPKLLRFIPGTAQDVRAYFLTMQYWLAGSDDNIANMVRLLIERYADGPRRAARAAVRAGDPVIYPDVGIYHPRMKGRIGESVAALPGPDDGRPVIGLLVMRSYVLAGNSLHYDAVIAALESRGLRVIPAYSSGLDARPAIERFFVRDDRPIIDALVSLTGFSLVGGPAYNDSQAAAEMLGKLDVPYIAANPLEFQTVAQWGGGAQGLMPLETTIMVAIPELDGATGSIVFGGRGQESGECTGCDRRCRFESAEQARDMAACSERVDMLARRVHKQVELRRSERANRRVGIVLFNFPPNSGAVGSAAHLSVFSSLHNTLRSLAAAGYSVEVPDTVDALRRAILEGNSGRHGTPANVHAWIDADDHVRREPWLSEVEQAWGPAPGKHLTDGRRLFVLGERFGNVFVGVQPGLGYEGDPMRLLFERGFAPTHAFCAFYRWMREDFAAHAVLHFGTHGALEFMPGKQNGLSGSCWPDRLIADLPNLYLYASNNPSEGAIAKRRSAATLISYLTPSVANAGLYRGLADLKASLDQWRTAPPAEALRREELAEMIVAQAIELDLLDARAATDPAIDREPMIAALGSRIIELEQTLIPCGLHVVGDIPSESQRTETLSAVARTVHGFEAPRDAIEAIVRTGAVEPSLASQDGVDRSQAFAQLAQLDAMLVQDHETPALLRALDGRFIEPAPGGDLLRSPDVLPTGRNLHGFDPFRIPSAWALSDGARQAQRLLDRHVADGNPLPESIALVLWGTDNLKSEGGPIGQALALMGARPRFDSYGRLAGAELVALDELGRPRIDVVMTLSGIFRDLLPLQIRTLAEAALLAASADEPAERNFIRKHALAYCAEHHCSIEDASLRVFSNADGSYGSNVNHLIDSSCWDDEDELADCYTRRKCFAYGRSGRASEQPALLQRMLADVDLTYQNLDSVELGVTTVDHYFDTLGGITRAVQRVKSQAVPIYIGDQTASAGTVRTLSEQVALESRTRVLNPKWYESMLDHGYEGVRQIEAHVTNTMGWSATTGQVPQWVYQQITTTFVLDETMRERLASLNPSASAKVANRLLEAHERRYWTPDESTLEALRAASEDLEDRLEGISARAAA